MAISSTDLTALPIVGTITNNGTLYLTLTYRENPTASGIVVNVLSRDQCVRGESRSFLERVFGGAAQPLLVQLVQEAKLSPEDIAEPKRILREKEKA